ncbi:hypothetical protein BH10BAC2_BH10BAC2_10910 [soil metagenome]
MPAKLITACLLLAVLQTNAQQKDSLQAKKKFTFHAIVQAGLLKGESNTASQLQSINGVQYKTWFGGIGIGIDQYHIRTVPVFASIRKDLLNKASTPFVYADIGAQIMWPRNKEEWQYGNQEFKAGVYYDAGAGYKLGIVKKHALLVSAGYSLKKFSYSNSYIYPCFNAPCPEYKNSTEYILRRLSFRLGFMF